MQRDHRQAIVVFGAGGHGRVVADAALMAGIEVLGFLDDSAAASAFSDLPILGNLEWLIRAGATRAIAPGIGDNTIRARTFHAAVARGATMRTVVHPSAAVSPRAHLAVGAVVLANAVVGPGARIGRAAIVNSGAVVEHDANVGDFAHVSPNATLTGAASLGDFAHLGAAACILPGKKVGDRTVIGAGAVVTRDLPPSCVAVGMPARVLRVLAT